jgi:hypothetical protein
MAIGRPMATSNNKRLAKSAMLVGSAVLLLVIGLCCNKETVAAAGEENITYSTNVEVEAKQAHRKAIAYSKLATIPPDPDSRPVGDDVKEELAAKYGHWHFWDGEEDNRPENEDMCDKYPNCDVPDDDFPEDSWQGDAVFVNHILNDADELVTRAMEAIFEEYGHPKPKSAELLAERMKMFHWDKIDFKTADGPPEKFKKAGNRGNGGWTTKRSFEGYAKQCRLQKKKKCYYDVVGHSSVLLLFVLLLAIANYCLFFTI